MIEKGSFREDLYYRLNVFPIESPSLAQRAEDIPLLLKEGGHFMTVFGANKSKSEFVLGDPWIGYSDSGVNDSSRRMMSA